jgi:hypothetical protein
LISISLRSDTVICCFFTATSIALQAEAAETNLGRQRSRTRQSRRPRRALVVLPPPCSPRPWPPRRLRSGWTNLR